MRITRSLGWVALFGIGMACGGGDGGGNSPDISIDLSEAPNGNAQTGSIGSVLPDSLRVIVTKDGTPVVGTTVTWTAGTNAGSVSPTSSVTDAAGRAATQWTVGTVSGAHIVEASASDANDLVFTATVLAGPPVDMFISSGAGQSTPPSRLFPIPLNVKIVDSLGNGVQNITVAWEVFAGNVSLSNGTTSVSNNLGIAVKLVTSGPALGSATVRATSPAVLADTLDFDLTIANAPVGVTLGNTFFRSVKNDTQDPAVDTVQSGNAVKWTNTSGTHTVRSVGSPAFASSGNLIGDGATYTVIFQSTGTYQYDCSIHGGAMTGRIVVVP